MIKELIFNNQRYYTITKLMNFFKPKFVTFYVGINNKPWSVKVPKDLIGSQILFGYYYYSVTHNESNTDWTRLKWTLLTIPADGSTYTFENGSTLSYSDGYLTGSFTDYDPGNNSIAIAISTLD